MPPNFIAGHMKRRDMVYCLLLKMDGTTLGVPLKKTSHIRNMDFVILACVVLTQCQRVTDRRMDGQTDRHPDYS